MAPIPVKLPSILLGAHMSIAGGVSNAVLAGHRTGCNCIQLFTKNSNQWQGKPLTEKDILLFKQAKEETDINLIVAHDSYLINIASPNPELRNRSIDALLDELERSERLGIQYLVMHPGAHMGQGALEGLKRVAEALNLIHSKTVLHKVIICLENTAGQGTTLGRSFEELQSIISYLETPERIGICLDTCHLFAAGYDISTRTGFLKTIADFDTILGFNKLKVVHLNDSKKGLSSHIDRHEHIGKGMLGLEPFKSLLNDPRFKDLPLILETPKGETDQEDLDNLYTLRNLI